MKKRIINIAISIVLLLLFIVHTILVIKNKYYNIDCNVINKVLDFRGNKNGLIYYITRFLTEFGNVYIVILILLFVIIKNKLNLGSILLTVSVLVGLLINVIIKCIVRRSRPDALLRWMKEVSYSYPSSHSITCCILYGFIIFILLSSNYKKIYKIIMSITCLALILIIGMTRIILCVHYFSDVIGGYLLGLLIISISIFLHDVLKEKYKDNLYLLVKRTFKKK